jgi:hypothetical protein
MEEDFTIIKYRPMDLCNRIDMETDDCCLHTFINRNFHYVFFEEVFP